MSREGQSRSSGDKKETTAAGNLRFTADRGRSGHSDRFWALALARHAAGKTQTGITNVEGIRFGGNRPQFGRFASGPNFQAALWAAQ